MLYIYVACFFLLGLLMGSFYCVLGMRIPEKRNFIFDHSRCDSCSHELKLYEMIPVFSYFSQEGKCRYCNAKISPLLPLVEMATGILYAISFFSFGFTLDFLLAILIISLLMIVLVSDLSYLMIPDSILIFFALCFLIVQYFRVGLEETFYHLLTGAFLFVLMYLIMCLGNKLFKKESLGGGDIKMLFLFGLILDPLLGTLSIFLGSFIALPISIIIFIKCKENIIPFGPFLLLSFLLIYFSKITPEMILTFLGI